MSNQRPEWTQIRPPRVQYSRTVALAYDRTSAAVVLFVQGVGVDQREVWAWDGRRFVKRGDSVFPGHQFGSGLHAISACHDRMSGGALLFGYLSDAVLMSTADDPSAVRRLALPVGIAKGSRPFAGFRLGDRLLFVAGDGSVFDGSESGDTLALETGPLADLTADHPLCTAALDPDRGILVASTDDDGRLFAFRPDGGWSTGLATDNEGNSLAWNPSTGRVEVLGPERSNDPNPQRLRPWDELGAAGPRVSWFTRQAPICFDEARGGWLLLDRGNVVYWATPPGDFEFVPTPGHFPDPTTDQYLTATTTGPVWAHQTVWDHIVHWFDGEQWRSPERSPRDMKLVAATPHGLAVLTGDGELKRVETGGRMLRLAPADESVAGASYSYANDRLCWDELAGELVLWRAGEDSSAQETWVHRGGRWTEIADTPCPPHTPCPPQTSCPPAAPSLLCPSPAGIYCLAEGQLWLLAEDRWRQVGDGVDPSTRIIFCPSRHGGLWSASPDGICLWREGRFELVAGLPPMIELVQRKEGSMVLFDTRSRLVHDPAGDQVLLYGGGGTWTIDLASCGVTGATLPGATAAVSVSDRSEPPARPSCYVLEASGSSDWHKLEVAFVETDLLRLEGLVQEQICVREGADETELGLALEHVGGDFIWRVWTVQGGVLSHGVDLLPHFRVHFRDGTSLAPDEPHREEIWDREDDAVAMSIDWAAAVEGVPALREPLLQPGEALELQVPSTPDGLSSGCLGHGSVLRHRRG